MKKIINVIICVCLLVTAAMALGACRNSKPVIGIMQFGSHASLNNCYDGIINGLRENGIDMDKYDIQHVNSNFDGTLAQSQAKSFVNGKAEVIIAIATPCAVAAATAADGEIPVVYCAVTDATVMENYDNTTGSSDIPDFAKQLEVVSTVMDSTSLRIGVLLSSEESSSPIQVTNLKKAAEDFEGDITVINKIVQDINTIDTAVNDLIADDVDCLINLLDNTIVGKLESNILPLTDAAGIPVFGSEVEQVKVGCAASASIEYLDVGFAAGKAAADILKGGDAQKIPVAYITDPKYYYNREVCEKLKLTAPVALGATDVNA